MAYDNKRPGEYEAAVQNSIYSDVKHDPATGDSFRTLYKTKVKVFKFENNDDVIHYEEIKTKIFSEKFVQYSESESWTKDGERCHHLLVWGEPYTEKIEKPKL